MSKDYDEWSDFIDESTSDGLTLNYLYISDIPKVRAPPGEHELSIKNWLSAYYTPGNQ